MNGFDKIACLAEFFAKSGHMHDAKIVIEGPDKLRTEWSYWNEGMAAGEKTVFEVTRVK